MVLKVISFDVEGTLVTEEYSEYIWHQKIPELYACVHKIDFESAKKYVASEYTKIDENDIAWYDIKYWFAKFQLPDCREVLKASRNKIAYYSDVLEVLEELSKKYKLVISTNSDRLFLEFQLEKIKHYFDSIFSATSDFKIIKKQPAFFLKICNILRVKPSEICHIGDRYLDDFVAPNQIGMKAFLVNRKDSGKKTDLKTITKEILGLP